eukprot:2928477-Amphidinium_carterae.1
MAQAHGGAIDLASTRNAPHKSTKPLHCPSSTPLNLESTDFITKHANALIDSFVSKLELWILSVSLPTLAYTLPLPAKSRDDKIQLSIQICLRQAQPSKRGDLTQRFLGA